MPDPKISWRGVIRSVQPRIRLTRSFDERSHEYLGYVLGVHGTVGTESARRDFSIAIGEAAQESYQFQHSDDVSGESERVADPRTERADLYKTARLELHERAMLTCVHSPPPWHGTPEKLEVYRERGHRRLAAKTFESKCGSCVWGARMATVLIVDHWNPSKKRYRVETFCYGPKSCPFYRPGPPRNVPGRKGMSWTEEDWVDEEATRHRGEDD